VVIRDGASGESCSVVDGPADGEHTVTCGGTTVVISDGAAVGEGEGEGEGEPPCRTLFGSVAIQNSDDLLALADVCVVTGDIGAGELTGLTSFSLPRLATVGGSLSVNSLDGTSGNSALVSISLPLLTTVGGELELSRNTGVTGVSLPLLANVGGRMTFLRDGALPSIVLPNLTSCGDITISVNASLTSISLPALASAGSIDISEDPALTSCTGAPIVSVGDCVQ
jgi:hypothetical protein